MRMYCNENIVGNKAIAVNEQIPPFDTMFLYLIQVDSFGILLLQVLVTTLYSSWLILNRRMKVTNSSQGFDHNSILILSFKQISNMFS